MPESSESYLSLISLGQDLQKIQRASFLIQLQAINSLIHLSRKKDENSGFSAVSKDLMEFSVKISSRTEELTLQLQNLLKRTTTLHKSKRFLKLVRKSGSRSKEIQEKLILSQNRLKEDLDSVRMFILRKVEESSKLCKIGNVIVVCSKIEAAYMKSENMIYSKLSEDVDKSIDSISESFQSMKSILANAK